MAVRAVVAMGPGSRRRIARRLVRGDAKRRRFSFSGDVSFKKPNNRHDALKVESLLGYGGYMDLEQRGGALGLSSGTLEKPIKAFQAKNGLEVDGRLKPGGPTIKKMKELYGGVFGGTPAPTPAMVDAHVEKRDAGEDGFLHDEAPRFGVKPHRRLDGKAHLMEFERWNRDWARGSGNDPAGLAREYESYIRDLDKDHGHDPGLIFARDLTQQVEKYHGKGGELAKQLVTRLVDRPDLQREYLGGEVPKAPPIGTFKPGGEEGVKAWIDQDRAANGLAPRYAIPVAARVQSTANEQRVSARGLPASEAINLFDLAQEMQGLPEDEALRQQAAQDQERAQQAPQNDQRPVPEYWPQGSPPTAEDWGLHKNPPHEPDQPNPRPVDPHGLLQWSEPMVPPKAEPVPYTPSMADETPNLRDEFDRDAKKPGRPPRVEGQVSEELTDISHDERNETPHVRPEIVDLSKLDDDAFEAQAAKAQEDRGRLEADIQEARERETRHRAELQKALGVADEMVAAGVISGTALAPLRELVLDALTQEAPKIDPKRLASFTMRGAGAGVAIGAGSAAGQVLYHLLGATAAAGWASAGEAKRGEHNEWENEIRNERINRGRIRPDN